MRQQLYHWVQKVVRLKFSEKMGRVFSKNSKKDKFEKALGPEAESLIGQENKEIEETSYRQQTQKRHC